MPTPTTPPSLSDIRWLHTDVSGWARTSTITRVHFTPSTLTLDHTHRSGQWPAVTVDGTLVEGNPWIVGYAGGAWHAATYEWLRPGQTRKNITAANIGPHTKVAPLTTWTPTDGELVGFLVSGLARSNARNVEERTGIVWVQWGTDTILAREEEPPSPVPVPVPPPEPTPPPVPPPEPVPAPVCQCRYHPTDLAEMHERLARIETALLSVALEAGKPRSIEIDAKWLGTLTGVVR